MHSIPEKLTIWIVDGASRTPLDLRQFSAEPRRDLPPMEPTVVCGVLITELQYSALADPRFEPLARAVAEQNLTMEMESEGILWITQPYGIRDVDLRWTPDEPGWRIIKGISREFSAPDLASALRLAFTLSDHRMGPEEKLLSSIFQRPKAYD